MNLVNSVNPVSEEGFCFNSQTDMVTNLELAALPAITPALLPRKAGVGPAPLSYAQERLWFLDQINPGDVSANISCGIRIKGNLKLELLQRSLQASVNRHESLRTTFATSQLDAGRDSKPVQLIAATRTIEIPVIDLSGEPVNQREAKARDLARDMAQRPFDLTLGPLLQATLFKLGGHEYVLVLCLHRIVCDDRSLQILIGELFESYSALTNAAPSPIAPLQIQYADYAIWQRQLIEEEGFKPALEFWRAKVEGAPGVIELPTDRPKPPLRTWHGQRVQIDLDQDLIEPLRVIAASEDAPLAMVLLAAFKVVLARHSRQFDLVVGTTIPNRDVPEVKHLVGPLSNLLSLRSSLSGDPSFRELLSQVKNTALEAHTHCSVPFEKLLDELRVERSLNHAPVFQVTFNLEPAHNGLNEVAGLILEEFEFDDRITRFDLMVDIFESPNRLSCRFRYSTDLFNRATIERFGDHFNRVLEGIVCDSNQRVSDLPLMTESERKQVLVDWNNTETDRPQAQCISQLFESQVARTPEATAAIFGTERLSYTELNCRANQLAHYLQKLGIGPDARVGICIGRSMEMAIGVLAVLKAGAAYVPLDPAYPADRLRFMIDDAGSVVLLTDRDSAENLPNQGRTVLFLDRDWEQFANESERNLVQKTEAENLAYVIYTSGSTGQPKGVAMTQAALVNMVAWQTGELPPARTLQFASLSFDVSFQEMFSAWCSGGTVILIRQEVRQDVRAVLNALMIERLFLPFVFLQHLAEIYDDGGLMPRYLREVITAGEQLEITPQIARFFTRVTDVALLNHYGPSESHVVTAYELAGAVSDWPKLPPIGRPISNTRIYIVDEKAHPVPIGVPGELCLGGVSLSRGYLNRPELTAEKYAPDPFSHERGARIYRTGDLARYLPDGNIEFLGRIDSQVKIRGYRIELGEIETVLREHSLVRDVAVVARQGKLVAYVVAAAKSGDVAKLWSELRDFIKAKLPEYMSPAIFVDLDALPLTPSGKVDRRALPAPDESRPDLQQAYVAPQNPVEEQLVTLWSNVLQLKSIGIRDNFFELGGHSLLAARLFAQIENRFGKHLSLATLFQSPTIEQLANVLRDSSTTGAWSSLVAIQSEGSRPPLFCIHPGGANVLIYRPLSRHLGNDQPIYALQAQGLDGHTHPFTRVEDMAAHYIEEIQTFQPEGPYHLLGASFGGLVVYEMAYQLTQQGQKVGLVAMLNTDCPVYTLGKRIASHFVHLRQHGPWLYGGAVIKGLMGRLNIHVSAGDNKADQSGNSEIDPELQHVLERRHGRDEALVNTVLAIMQADAAYLPKGRIYPGKITLFRAVNASQDFHDNRLGWRSLARGGLEVHDVPGTHTSMREEPNVAVLVEKLRPCLDKAQAQSRPPNSTKSANDSLVS